MHCDAIQLMANRNPLKWGTQQVSILPKEFPSAALKPQMTLTMGAPPAVASDGQAWPEPLAACRADVVLKSVEGNAEQSQSRQTVRAGRKHVKLS